MDIFPFKRQQEGSTVGKEIPFLAGLLWAVISFHVYAGDVIVTVDRFADIRNKAPVRFSICSSDECHRKKDKGYVEIKAHLIEQNEHVRTYKINRVAPGEYSLSAYHDLNNSGILERSGILGIPREPIGFSRLDIHKIQRHPKWDEVKFTVSNQETLVNVHLIHRFGL